MKAATALEGILRLVARSLDYRIVQYGLLATCVLVMIKRSLAIESLGVDSWAPMFLALDYLAAPGAGRLFDVLFFDSGVKFQYPPPSLLVLEPLYRSGVQSVHVLNAINLVLMGANAWVVGTIAVKLAGDALTSAQRGAVRYGLAFVALYYEPIMLGYTIGQIQIALNLLFSASCLLLISRKEGLAGGLIGLATIIKPQFGPLLLIQLVQRRWHFARGLLICAGVLTMVSVLMYGFSNHLDYLRVLSFLSERGEAFHLNESVNGIAHRLLGNGSAFEVFQTSGVWQSAIPPHHPVVTLVTRVTAVLFLALPFVAMWMLKPQRDSVLLYCLCAASTLLASPIAWTHHYGVLLPMYPVLVHSVLKAGQGVYLRLALAGASFVLTGLRFPEFRDTEGWATLLHAPVYFGALLLVTLLLVQLGAETRYARSVERPLLDVGEVKTVSQSTADGS